MTQKKVSFYRGAYGVSASWFASLNDMNGVYFNTDTKTIAVNGIEYGAFDKSLMDKMLRGFNIENGVLSYQAFDTTTGEWIGVEFKLLEPGDTSVRIEYVKDEENAEDRGNLVIKVNGKYAAEGEDGLKLGEDGIYVDLTKTAKSIEDAVTSIKGETEEKELDDAYNTLVKLQEKIKEINTQLGHLQGTEGGGSISDMISTAINGLKGETEEKELDDAYNTLVKLQEKIKVLEAINYIGEGAITISEDNKIGLKIKEGEKVLSQTVDGLFSTLTLSYDKEAKTITLAGIDNASLGVIDTTDFVVDGFLESVEYSKEEGEEKTLLFTWNTAAGATVTKIDLSEYIDTYYAGNGLELDSESKTFSVKLDTSSEEFLTVGTNGVKLSGVEAMVDQKIENSVLVWNEVAEEEEV